MRVRVVVLALLLAAPALAAQNGSASEVMTSAVRAYRDLDFEVAARLLRRGGPPPLAGGLHDRPALSAPPYPLAPPAFPHRAGPAAPRGWRVVCLPPPSRPAPPTVPP